MDLLSDCCGLAILIPYAPEATVRSHESLPNAMLLHSPQRGSSRSRPFHIAINNMEIVSQIEGSTVKSHMAVGTQTQDISFDVGASGRAAKRLYVRSLGVALTSRPDCQCQTTHLARVLVPLLDPADDSRVADDAFDRGRPSPRGRLAAISTVLIDSTLTLSIENVSDLLLNRCELLRLSGKSAQLKPADPKTGLAYFGPLIDDLVEPVIPIPTDGRVVSLTLTPTDNSHGVTRYSTPPKPRVSPVLPRLILYLPTSIPVPATGTRIDNLVPFIEIVFIPLIQHDRIRGPLSVGIKPPRDTRLTLFVKLGVFNG